MISGIRIMHYGLVLVEDGDIEVVHTYNLIYSTKAYMEFISIMAGSLSHSQR